MKAVTSVFDFSNYREFIKAWLLSQAGVRRGLKTELARKMGISSSLMSQILKGDKEISFEQASEAAEHFGFTELETDYWFLLVGHERAGTHKLRARFERKMKQARQQARDLSKRAPKDVELSEEVKGVFYSSWMYAGVRNLTAVPNSGDVGAVARRLSLPPAVVARVVQFLLEHGLCVVKDGTLTYGPAHTFMEKDSPHAIKAHRNWRLRAMQVMELRAEEDFFFSSPMSLSAETAREIRELLPNVVQEIYRKIGPSSSETVACLNIDWFDYSGRE